MSISAQPLCLLDRKGEKGSMLAQNWRGPRDFSIEPHLSYLWNLGWGRNMESLNRALDNQTIGTSGRKSWCQRRMR